MLIFIGELNGQKIEIPVTADVGAGNPVGTIIVTYASQVPSNYLPLGTQFDATQYPLLYALLGTDTTPTASALGLPTLTSGQYAIKATSGLTEGQQDDVANIINGERSYSTTEINTGKKWIDGKPIYRKVLNSTMGVIDGSSIVYTNIDVSDLNIDTIVNMTGLMKAKTYTYPIPYTWDNGSLSKMIYHSAQTRIRVGSNATGASEHDIYVTLEYTKTTD